MRKHLQTIPRAFHCEIPPALADEIAKAPEGHVTDVGVEWALAQTRELIDAGVPAVHFYVMSAARAVNMLMAKLSR
jgi:methylenetetrahydrofolate reductase (NADPH)